MGVVTQAKSPYYWVNLERPGQRPLRLSTKIPITGATPEQEKEHRALAEAAYASMMGDLARVRFELPTERGRQIRGFDPHARWYEEHHTAHHAGAARERQIIARLRVAFGRLALEEITPIRWQEYVTARRRDGVAMTTIGRELCVLKCILKTAVGVYLTASPLADVTRSTPRQKPKRVISAAEEPAFLKALHAIDPELHDLYLVGVGTLLREENLIYLQRREHCGDYLSLDTKTGPHRVPLKGPTELQRRAARVLRRRMPATPDGFFFPRWHARFAPYDDPGHPRVQFLRCVKRAATAVGIPWGLKEQGIVWHTATRATGATRMLRDYQIDIRTVQIVGNWASLDQMAEYLGIDLDELFGRRAKRRLA
jgi:integrase